MWRFSQFIRRESGYYLSLMRWFKWCTRGVWLRKTVQINTVWTPHILLILPQCLAFASQATWICWSRAMAAVLSAKLCWAWGTVWVTGDEPCALCLHSDRAAPDGNGISMRLDGEAPWGEIQVFPLLWARAELEMRACALLTSHKNSFGLVVVFFCPTLSLIS